MKTISLKYDIAFTPQEINEFSLLDSFGVPLEQLKSLLALKIAERNKPGTQSGIPYKGDISENELSYWIYYSNAAVVMEQQAKGVEKIKEIEIAIKGSSKEKYPVVKTYRRAAGVIRTLPGEHFRRRGDLRHQFRGD